MIRPFENYVPKDLPELVDLSGMMVISSPTFVNKIGYFDRSNITTIFTALNASLELTKGELGYERHARFVEMSARMQAHFKADPEDKTDDTLKGRALIDEMIDDLDKHIRVTRNLPPRQRR